MSIPSREALWRTHKYHLLMPFKVESIMDSYTTLLHMYTWCQTVGSACRPSINACVGPALGGARSG